MTDFKFTIFYSRFHCFFSLAAAKENDPFRCHGRNIRELPFFGASVHFDRYRAFSSKALRSEVIFNSAARKRTLRGAALIARYRDAGILSDSFRSSLPCCSGTPLNIVGRCFRSANDISCENRWRFAKRNESGPRESDSRLLPPLFLHPYPLFGDLPKRSREGSLALGTDRPVLWYLKQSVGCTSMLLFITYKVTRVSWITHLAGEPLLSSVTLKM